MAVKQHNTTRWLVCAGAFLLVLMLAAATPRPTWADGGARGPDAPGRLADLGNPTMGDPDQPDDGPMPSDGIDQSRTQAVSVSRQSVSIVRFESWIRLLLVELFALSSNRDRVQCVL